MLEISSAPSPEAAGLGRVSGEPGAGAVPGVGDSEPARSPECHLLLPPRPGCGSAPSIFAAYLIPGPLISLQSSGIQRSAPSPLGLRNYTEFQARR